MDDVVEKLKAGDSVLAVWSHPDGGIDLPVEIVTLPCGEESVKVVAGGPAGINMVNLKTMDQ